MLGLLADVNMEGQFERMMKVCTSERWREIWSDCDVDVFFFDDIGLKITATDSEVWRECQQRGLILVTGNRNDDGPDSLEATIRSLNTLRSLPVLTIGDVSRLQKDGSYLERVVERLLEFVLDIETYRGSGRLYLP